MRTSYVLPLVRVVKRITTCPVQPVLCCQLGCWVLGVDSELESMRSTRHAIAAQYRFSSTGANQTLQPRSSNRQSALGARCSACAATSGVSTDLRVIFAARLQARPPTRSQHARLDSTAGSPLHLHRRLPLVHQPSKVMPYHFIEKTWEKSERADAPPRWV